MKFSRYLLFSYLLILPLLTGAAPAWGDDTIDDLLTLGTAPQQKTVSPPPVAARPASRIAENMTVITSKQITSLNAHSLADVLRTVPGINVNNNRSPGSWTQFDVQGEADTNGTILLLIDGISQGNLLQGTNDPGLIPVQHIERIEIIKGSASAAWGAALGGVINVVTKNPLKGQAAGGSVAASYGERNTAHLTAELSGTGSGIGYYLAGGNLHSSGLLPNNGTNRNNLYGKLSYDLPLKGNLTVGGSYIEAKRGSLEIFDVDGLFIEHDNGRDIRHYVFFNFTYPLQPDLTLELSGQSDSNRGQAIFADDVSILPGTITPYAHYVLHERNNGANARLNWGDSHRNLKAGVEYLHSNITQIDQLNNPSPYDVDRSRDSLAVYANGAYTINRLTLLPGIRYVHTGLSEDVTNYTMGATYKLSEKTLLRTYGARGYALPTATLGNTPKRIWTTQAGVESEEIPYLWLKGTYFYNHVWNDVYTPNKYNRQGFEVEVKTVPIFHTSLSGGYTYTDARDADTREVIRGVPRHIAKVAATYNCAISGTQAVLTGNYAFLNIDKGTPHYPHYSPMVWDLFLTQKLQPGNELSPELFFSGHNLFNGEQHWDYWYQNTGRWVEGGVRFRF
ncbi:MAG: TonB-dependent receptor [Geobacter sp.]|nr:TonB-dependent receptor [Geobacter sp.]